MAAQSLVICYTNLFIEFYKNNTTIVDNLRAIGQANIAMSVVTAGELIYGALNKKELRQILSDIRQLTTITIDADISSGFMNLMAEYSLSHKLSLPDAIIAATAIRHDVPLYTLNKKDFRYLPELKLLF